MLIFKILLFHKCNKEIYNNGRIYLKDKDKQLYNKRQIHIIMQLINKFIQKDIKINYN